MFNKIIKKKLQFLQLLDLVETPSLYEPMNSTPKAPPACPEFLYFGGLAAATSSGVFRFHSDEECVQSKDFDTTM